MRSRSNGLGYGTGALLFAASPPSPLRAQEGAGMMQDEKTTMTAEPEPGMLYGVGGHKAAGSTEARPVSGSVTLAKLDRLAGEQLIDVPANIDPNRYSHLLLWSKKTGAVLAVAGLPSGAMGKMDDKMGNDDKMEPTKDEMQDGSMSKSP